MKEFMAGIIGAIGVWMIVIPVREALLITYGTQNQYVLGVVLLLVALWLGGQK